MFVQKKAAAFLFYFFSYVLDQNKKSGGIWVVGGSEALLFAVGLCILFMYEEGQGANTQVCFGDFLRAEGTKSRAHALESQRPNRCNCPCCAGERTQLLLKSLELNLPAQVLMIV